MIRVNIRLRSEFGKAMRINFCGEHGGHLTNSDLKEEYETEGKLVIERESMIHSRNYKPEWEAKVIEKVQEILGPRRTKISFKSTGRLPHSHKRRAELGLTK